MDRLMFILFYFKLYPTQDLLGVLFEQSQPWAHKWVHRLTPVVEDALGRKMELPLRPKATMEELQARCPGLIFLLDGVERPILRPQESEAQKVNYSGKKKHHTRKHVVVTSEQTKEIVVLGTAQGVSCHDKQALDQSGLSFPAGSVVYEDKGFQGHEELGVHIIRPKKKPKGRELSLVDHVRNGEISTVRVRVEHAIRGAKIFRISKDTYRNRKKGFEDRSMLISAGLYNHRLRGAMKQAA